MFISCNDKKVVPIHVDLNSKYEKLHDKYRTLWYRTGQQCFYDSSRKYGLLANPESANPIVYGVDTTTLNEPTPDCK